MKAAATEGSSIPTTIKDEPETFQPWTIYRTYYGEPESEASKRQSDLAWKNLQYLLHYWPEYGGQFVDDKSMIARSYSDPSLGSASAEEIIQKLIIEKLDYSSMAFTLESEPTPFGCTIILADKDILANGSGLLKYVQVGGDNGKELDRKACPLIYTQAWWNVIQGLGKSVEDCLTDHLYDPDDVQEQVKFV
ncbi:hypothetical protein ABW19_dt0209722 [Dactylella cylindrospora]|nr:hypothetical protein ABW19_dt0209722 [Dactylella cylindrospora]